MHANAVRHAIYFTNKAKVESFYGGVSMERRPDEKVEAGGRGRE
jgi:hypothetical protein